MRLLRLESRVRIESCAVETDLGNIHLYPLLGTWAPRPQSRPVYFLLFGPQSHSEIVEPLVRPGDAALVVYQLVTEGSFEALYLLSRQLPTGVVSIGKNSATP